MLDRERVLASAPHVAEQLEVGDLGAAYVNELDRAALGFEGCARRRLKMRVGANDSHSFSRLKL